MKCYKIWWSNDDRFPPDAWRIIFAPIFDLFIVASTNSVQVMKELGTDAEYLIMGYIKKAYENKDRNINMAFLGQNSGEIFSLSKLRRDICTRLYNEIEDFELFGRGWGGNIEHQAKNIYHRVKIGLSIGHQNNGLVYSNRMLDIMGHGAMCLCYRTSNLESIFIEGETCVYFDNYDELVEKYYYYIENDAERERIALNGREFVENNLTWKHKAEPIIKMLKDRL
jgi:hypothetical protein